MLAAQISRNLLYLDENLDSYSNTAIGNLVRAIGEGKYIAYINCDKKASKFTNFLENLSLSYEFLKNFPRLRLDIYIINEKKITKSLLPMVEFNTIDENFFWPSLKNYDVVIFDNFDEKSLSKYSLISALGSKNPSQSIITITKDKETFKELSQNFSEHLEIKSKKQNTLAANKNIVAISGDGLGKSTYAFGHLIREFIQKKDVKLIYFDKGNYFGEMVFFSGLKKWSKLNTMYGTFDFVITGINRFQGNLYRDENRFEDTLEAREALRLLDTAIKKQSPVLADELTTVIDRGLLDIREVEKVLEDVGQELIITGNMIHPQIKSHCNKIIEIKKN